MDEPMEDICTDPINNGAGETQYVSVEIDTQATDGYDDAVVEDNIFKQIPDGAPRAPPVFNANPRYKVPLDQDEPVMDFKFAKPAHTTPVLRTSRPSADTVAPSRRGQTPSSEICSSAQESHQDSAINGPLTTGEAKVLAEATIENDEAELPLEVGASQRPALKKKDSNAQLSTNIPTRQQTREISFAAGPISNDRQPIKSLRPQQARQFTSTPPPLPDVQHQTKKRYRSVLDGTPRLQSVVSPQQEAIARTLRQKSQSGPMPPTTGVDNEFNVGHLSEQHASSSGHGPPFAPKSETRAHWLAATGNTECDELSPHMPSKSAANQTRRASICFKDNDRIRKLPAANIPFPETTYPTTPHTGNGQRMHETSRPMLTNKPGRKRDAVSPCVNLQSIIQISPKFALEGGSLKDSSDGRGSTPQSREATSYSRQTSNPPSELLQGIEAYMEKEKQALFEQIEEKDAKINEVSKKNGDYKETINELRRTNASLSEKFAVMREKADALHESVTSQFEEHKSLGAFVTKHKLQDAEYRHEAESMRTSLMEAKSGLQSLQIYQQNSKVGLEETRALAISQIENYKSLEEGLGKYKTKLQEEMEKSQLLQKELKARHQEKGLKDTIKDLLDNHCLSVTDRLAIQENKVSEAISNTDRENQSRLSDCLRLLESTIGKPPRAPKEMLEMTGLIETLSTNISDRLQSADDGSETLRNAGTEVMEALKTRLETLFEIQDSRIDLDERISSLKVDNARLEVATRGREERILELQTQLTAKESELDRCRADSNVKSEWNRTQLEDRQKELDRYREELAAKESELRKAQAKIASGCVTQNELTILQETHAKSASDLADITKQLRDCQAALAEQSETANAMQVTNADLEKRLSSAEQKAIDVARELSQFKASASESLKRQRVEAETDRRKSLESEKRRYVQKASNLQRVRVEAEATAEGLKAESKKIKEDVEKKEQLIRALEAEKTTLEGKNKEQLERLAQLQQWSKFQVDEYHSLTEDLKSTTLNIAKLETKLGHNEEKAAADSRMVNDITETVEAIVHQHVAVVSRLESYERFEAKAQDYCRKSGISFEANTALDAILEMLARFESRTSDVARTLSSNNGVSDRADKPEASNGQATSFTPKVVRLKVPDSPEIQDSQMPSAPSSSPLPRQGVRSITSQSRHVFTSTTLPTRESLGDLTNKLTTGVAKYRESRPTKDFEDGRRHSPLHAPEIEDSQDKGRELDRSPSYSPLSETNTDELDQPHDFYMLASDHPENKKGRIGETARGQRLTAAPKKADVKPSKMQANKRLKSCLRQTMPRDNSVDDKSMMSNDTLKTPLSDSTSIKPPTTRKISNARVASISKVQDPTKTLSSDSNLIRGGSTPRSDSKQSIIAVRPEGINSEYNLRKRARCSAPSGMGSEPPIKQTRLSFPAGREFQPVSPFVLEESKRRESPGPSLRSHK
ncbi:hypothetical protein GMDG_01644 [Pseudogymnoascus destructans 20631-21]|uniref:Uncharacterized protein n=1 Tax=Pseudogymnoascus destructans (strain ATCC MYA-4855 / 20631-21) TaxID=658429 RepID=L8FZQ9_PSED2|nr:hypothetical protein GMDG_01644 [Pseudogymnoascus destructans 20631-21]